MHQKPLLTRRYESHQNILQVYSIFHLSISSCTGYFGQKVHFPKCKKFNRRGKNLLFFWGGGHNFFLLPSIISMQSWFEILFIRVWYDITHNSCLSSSFWENKTVTTCPCNNYSLYPISLYCYKYFIHRCTPVYTLLDMNINEFTKLCFIQRGVIIIPYWWCWLLIKENSDNSIPWDWFSYFLTTSMFLIS